ncbi:MAG TPA: adenosylcobinamide-GDP ribazoletransferase, partial [Chloroflexota bacterium]
MVGFLVALQFLTRLPSPIKHTITVEEMGRSTVWFPVVGLLIGALLAVADLLSRLLFPPSLSDALLVALLVVLTGALHLDGLMDTCDGVFSFKSPERRLEIMRDSRVGAFGVVGAALVILLKYAALGAVPVEHRPLVLPAVLALSRWTMVYALATFPYARDRGVGRLYKDHVGRRELRWASVAALAIAGALLGPVGLVAAGTAWAVAWIGARYITSKIPGLTGDSYGAINEMAEVFLLALVP